MSEIASNDKNEGNTTQSTVVSPSTVDAPIEEQVVNNNVVTDVAPEVAAAGDASGSATEDISPKPNNKKTPSKRTPSKRMSFIERAQKESEELVKNMGGSLELEGGRRTRSSTRGTPTRAAVPTPPPAKKARTSPPTGSTPSRARGRGRKIDTIIEPTETDEQEIQEIDSAEELHNDEDNDAKNSATSKSEDETTAHKTSKLEVEAKQKKESPKAEKKQDKVDAPLKPSSSENEQNNVDHTVKETQIENVMESLKSDSPMQTDEQSTHEPEHKPVEKVTDKVDDVSLSVIAEEETTKDASKSTEKSEAVAEKQPTPEPMEVDSSPNGASSDIIETTDALSVSAAEKVANSNTDVEKANSILPEVIESQQQEKKVVEEVAVSSVAPEENEVTEIPVEQKNATIESADGDTTIAAVVTNTEENNKNSTPAIDATNSIDISAAGEPLASVTAVATKDATPTNDYKSQNDICEPKIAASIDASESAPHYCK